MPAELILVPYDSAMRDARMGRGPLYLLRHGAAERLGSAAPPRIVEAPAEFRAEIATAFELNAGLARAAAPVVARGNLPVVLAGNCITSVGTLGGLGGDDVGVVWLDAHADFNTPETTRSGFLDGMALAVATGRCWSTLAGTVPGFAPVPEERVLLVAARDVDEAEGRALERSRVRRVGAGEVRARGVAAALGPALDALRAQGAGRVYLHVDLDAHDPSEGKANALAADGGLTAAEVRETVRTVLRHLPIAAAALTSFDPDHDADGRMLGVALELLAVLGEVARSP